MLYTVELDTRPGLCELGSVDVSAIAEGLEHEGLLDPVVSADSAGVIGFTAQIEASSLEKATRLACLVALASGLGEPEAVYTYLTPVLEEVEEAVA